MPYIYDHPRPAVTVDAIVFTRRSPPAVLLIQRGHEPFRGLWALPGGFCDIDEDLEAAARRELEEETGLGGVGLEQFRAYGEPERDPRGRSISIAFVGLVPDPPPPVKGADDAAAARFFDTRSLPLPLAFDHERIIREALERCEPSAR